MITLAFTYHQVMPTFLDLVFAFGEQQYERDFHFLGFRQDNRLDELDQGLKITELGWSGREFRLSYSLKSVEPSPDQTYFPWSIRQTAVYHSFDVETGRAIWIVIKGDQLLKSRIKSATGSRGLPELSSYQTVDRAFASALATHMILCHWPAEHWRWYISFLEEEYQAISRRTLSVSFKNSSRLMSGGIPIPSTQRVKSHNPVTAPSPKTRALPPIAPTTMPSNNGADARNDRLGQQEFSFTDLQRLQFLEEKANETHLVLEANINVLTELEHHYRSTAESQDWPQKLKSRDVLRFEKRVASIITELRMQRTRTENLLRSLANRKSLVIEIILHNRNNS